MVRARVRVVADVEVGNVDPGTGRKFRAGEEVDMILRGSAGKPLSAAAWWSSTDVDAAHILGTDDVEVLEMLGPYWTRCDGCGASGQTQEAEDGLSYLDTTGRIARRLAEARQAAEAP